MANLSNVDINGEKILIKDVYAREQLAHLTADNYTADVTGDYTVNAGDIAMSSANATMHTTADRTIDTDGNDSVHIDGASTLNVGGLRTETFAGDKTETVTGTETETAGNRNTTVTGKWSVNLPNKTFEMKDVALHGDVLADIKAALISVKSYGAIGDGIADDSAAFTAATAAGDAIYIPAGVYNVPAFKPNKALTIVCDGTIKNALSFTHDTTIKGGTYNGKLSFTNCKINVTGVAVDTNTQALHGVNVSGNVTNSRFNGDKDNIVLFENSNGVTVSSCILQSKTKTSKLHNIQLNACNCCTISDCFSENSAWFGYSLYNSIACTIANCISSNSYAEGVNLENTNSSIVNGCTLFWDTDKSNDYGLSVFGNNETSSNLNLISNNVIYQCAQSGIAIDGNAQQNRVDGNYIVLPNSKNIIRKCAIASAKLDGYTGRPGYNFFVNNSIFTGTYTEGLFEEIDPLSMNFVIGNTVNTAIGYGHVVFAYLANNINVQTQKTTLKCTGGTASESFLVGLGANSYLLNTTISGVTQGTEVSIELPATFKTSTLLMGHTTDGTTMAPIFPKDTTHIKFNAPNTGVCYVQCILNTYA